MSAPVLEAPADPRRQFTTRWKVRQYELDSFEHVNNAVYLNYVEQIAAEHVESLGVGRDWCRENGGLWLVRKHEITYRQPAVYLDELEITTRAESFKGATGTRFTTITRARDGLLLVDCRTEWVWIKVPEGRPARVPQAVMTALGF